jgi:hypothetical protein
MSLSSGRKSDFVEGTVCGQIGGHGVCILPGDYCPLNRRNPGFHRRKLVIYMASNTHGNEITL